MALDRIKFNIASFNDADAGGNNYYAGIVYEVFNSNDTLADIYSDAAGTNPINQDGISNKSNSSGEAIFYIDSGIYYIKVDGKAEFFDVIDSNLNSKYNPATIQDIIDSTEWDINGGEVIEVQEYYSGTGGGSKWKTIIAGTTDDVDKPNGTWIRQCVGVPNLAIKLKIGSTANIRKFGAKGDYAFDDTLAIRGALNYLKNIGGGRLKLPTGIFCLELQSGDTAPWCVKIPKNVTVTGKGRGSVITRLAANREQASILMVNEGADTAMGYDADGNITFENFLMTDSIENIERIQSVGDLIAIGHAENIKVSGMFFGNHTQHCLDIAGCKEVIFENNFQNNSNGLTGYADNAAVQIDSCNAAGFVGVNVDGTESINVTINKNRLINLNSNKNIHIGHNNGTVSGVIITENRLKGTARNFSSLIGCDANGASILNTSITGNIIECTSANNVGIAIFTRGNASEVLKNINISNNTIYGVARSGIIVGVDSNFTGSDYIDVSDFIVQNNNIDIDGTGSGLSHVGIEATIVDGISITDNSVKVFRDSDSIPVYGISAITTQQARICGNSVKPLITSLTGTSNTACIYISRYGSVATSAETNTLCAENTLRVSDVKWGIAAKALSFPVDDCTVSGNRFIGGAPSDAHIFEDTPASDGTNGYRSCDVTGSGGLSTTITTGDTITVSTGLIKKSSSGFIKSPEKITVSFTSGGVGNLATDTEDLTNNASNIGLQVRSKDPSLGTFKINTGSTGITATIQDGGSHSTRTSGSIAVKAGI